MSNPQAICVKSDLTFDFESVKNVYSYVLYYPETNTVCIRYLTDQSLSVTEAMIHKIRVLLKRHAEVAIMYHIGHYPTVDIAPITIEEFIQTFDDPTHNRVGFNNIGYDQGLIAYILDYIERYKILPPASTLRSISDLIISFNDTIKRNRTYYELAKKANLLDQYRLSIYRVLNFINSNTPESKLVPLYNKLSYSGHYLDVFAMNESDDEGASGVPSLKRIAAQLGFRIEEPDDVDLSNPNFCLDDRQFVTLMVYNVIDVIVTQLVFNNEDYQNVLATRTGMLERFSDRYKGRLTPNSTSAKFIEYTIAPHQSLVDDETISLFFPTQSPQFERLKQQLPQYYPPHASVAEIQQIDQQLTAMVQATPGFESVTPGVPRFRVHMKELQEDVLEYMKVKHPDYYSKSAYLLYSYFRGAKSPIDAIEKLKADYPEPPNDDFRYVYKTVKGEIKNRAWVVYEVPNSDMVISYSNGGVHGVVAFLKQYRDMLTEVTSYNHMIELLSAYSPDCQQLSQELTQETLPQDIINALENNAYVKRHKTPEMSLKDVLNMFIVFKTTKRNEAAGVYTNHYRRKRTPLDIKEYNKIVDCLNTVHADVDSLYPTLCILLHIFAVWNTESDDWDDLYKTLRDERLEKKAFAHSVPEELWTEEHRLAEFIQLLNKLLINAATGQAGRTKGRNNIQVPNKINAMRIIGQLILTDLVFDVAKNGGESTSTNTDGVFLDKIDFEVASDLVKNWREYYGISATPEIVYHFVSKDSNNRFEQSSETAAGRAAGGTIGNFGGASVKKKMSKPSIIDQAIVHYFKTHENVPDTHDIDRDTIYAFIEQQYHQLLAATELNADTFAQMLSFTWAIQPAGKSKYVLKQDNYYRRIQKVNRIVLTKTGSELLSLNISKPTKTLSDDIERLTNVAYDLGLIAPDALEIAKPGTVTSFDPQWRINRVNEDMSFYFKHYVWQHLDLDAYTDFAVKRLRLWQNPTFDDSGKPIKVKS